MTMQQQQQPAEFTPAPPEPMQESIVAPSPTPPPPAADSVVIPENAPAPPDPSIPSELEPPSDNPYGGEPASPVIESPPDLEIPAEPVLGRADHLIGFDVETDDGDVTRVWLSDEERFVANHDGETGVLDAAVRAQNRANRTPSDTPSELTEAIERYKEAKAQGLVGSPDAGLDRSMEYRGMPQQPKAKRKRGRGNGGGNMRF